ncbi:MAG: transcriptional regulator, TetR family [Rhodobacteraceae bacterium HLUCCA12]|nr:MAG: transcriptional regulator, TetR family [Rhodobacteraceae bacterium HLUCCA12]
MHPDRPSPVLDTADATKAERTRGQVLAASARLFRNEGYYPATLRKIARAAGVEAGSIYYHFSSKDEILDQVLDLGVRQLFRAVEAEHDAHTARGAPFRDTFAAMVGAHLTWLLAASDFTSANIRNFSMLPEEARARHRPLRRQYADLWDDFLRRARDCGDIRGDIRVVPLRQFILGALNWTVEWYDTSRYSIEAIADRLAKFLLDGLSTERGKPFRTLPIAATPATRPDGVDEPNKVDRTREQLLVAAAELMRQRGFKAATMRAIAEAAGIEAGSIYYHFRSKDEILDEVLDRGLRDIDHGVRTAFEQAVVLDDHRGRIATGVRAHLLYLLSLSVFTSANIRIYGQLTNKARENHRPIRKAFGAVWDEVLRDAQRDGAMRSDFKTVPMRQVLLGALNWTVEWFNPTKGELDGFYTLDEMIDMVQKLTLDGIAPITANITSTSRENQDVPGA